MSNLVPYRIQLDVKEVASQLSFSITKGDTGRRLIIQLVDDGKVFPIARGSYATFSADKPDGSTIFNDCTIQDDNIIYDITEQTVSCEGSTECEIVLYDSNGYRLTSPKFTIIVYEAIRTRVDLPSESEMTVLDAIGTAESQRKEAEFRREDNEYTRILNEGTRGIGEAYRIASINTLRAYLGNYAMPSIETPNDIFQKIDEGKANVSAYNFFNVSNSETIRCIAIIGDMLTAGDEEITDTTDFEIIANIVYFYKGARFVALNVQPPETTVFNELEDRVTYHENQAKEWADVAYDKVEEITNEENYNHANGFVRLNGNAKIPADLLPMEKTIEMIPIESEDDLETLSQANVGDIAFISESVYDEDTGTTKVLTKSWRLYGDYSEKNNWILQSNTFNSSALYSEEAGHAYDSTRVNGVLLRFGDIEAYNKADKDGVYFITNYAEEV